MSGYYIIQADDDVLLDEPAEHVDVGVEADVLYFCRHGAHARTSPDRPWPCGFAHSGHGFLHLAGGKTWTDYRLAVERYFGRLVVKDEATA